MISEKELIIGCKKGKRKYQRLLYDRFAPKMLGVCARYFKNIDEAQDAMQDGFIKVFENFNKYRGDGSLSAWIRRIMVNTSLNLHRKNLKHYYHDDVDEMQERIIDRAEDYDSFQVEEMLKLIQQLPDGYKLVFNLYEIEGYSHKEIAEKLNISINTSKSQLLKARKYLQKKLAILK